MSRPISSSLVSALVCLVAASVATAASGPGAITSTAPPAPTFPAPSGPSTAPPVRASVLTRVYRGDDGGLLYLRQLGAKVYGFGESPERHYAFVLSGSLTGDRITGSWWDVPKGWRFSRGSFSFRVTQHGVHLARSGLGFDDLGPDTFDAISPTGMHWPVQEAAGYQSRTASDLDGVFLTADGRRHYIREKSSNVVWVAEHPATPDVRLRSVSVFVGARDASGSVTGVYVDVPKGTESGSGTFSATPVAGKRELRLLQSGSVPRHRLVPDYALDWDRFAWAIEKKIEGKVVGYAYALSKDGALRRSGAGGLRRHALDGGNLPFTINTQAQTASAAKTIFATAIVKALLDRGLTVDVKVEPFLPSCWKKGFDIGSLTFRQILDHTSALPDIGCNGRDPYECLLILIREGRTQPRVQVYNTHAYDLLRVLVPMVADTKGTKALFELFDCSNKGEVLNRRVSERFVRYVFDEVLDRAGARASFYPSGDFSFNYRCVRRINDCEVANPGEAPRLDSFMRAGSGKLAMSVVDYVRFLGALDAGTLVPKSVVDAMKSEQLGFGEPKSGPTGTYAWKSGGCPDFDDGGHGCKTMALSFPGGIQAYVAVNSSNNAYEGSLRTIVKDALAGALRPGAVD